MRIVSLVAGLFSLAIAFPVDAGSIVYYTTLDGPSESPPVPSPGTGEATVTFDTVASTMRVEATWQGLVGTTTVAHIHCCTAAGGIGTIGVATYPGTFPGFPTGTTSGTYDATFDMLDPLSYTSGFLSSFGGGTAAGALAALLAGLDSGAGYFNIHSSFAPGGEIRGFLQRVPEPGTLALLGMGLAGLGLACRRRPN